MEMKTPRASKGSICDTFVTSVKELELTWAAIEHKRVGDRLQLSLRSTNAEFFDPKAMQLHTACSIADSRPASGV